MLNEDINLKTIAYNDVQLDNSVVCLGKFQGLHKGHMLLVNKTIELAQNNGLNSVIFTINVSNQKRIYTDAERKILLSDMGFDYNVTCEFSKEFASMTPRQFVENILIDKLGAKYIVVGTDFRFGCERKGDVSLLMTLGKEYGFEVIAIEKLSVDGTVVSSSYIRELVEAGNMPLVEKFMGRPYSISGIVTKGKQLGRTIGFPTVNIYPSKEKLVPLYGVYSSYAYIDDKRVCGMTNIGCNPTVNSSDEIFVETNLFDFDMDVYGRDIVVYLEYFVRPEKKFNSVEELKQQIDSDKEFILHQ